MTEKSTKLLGKKQEEKEDSFKQLTFPKELTILWLSTSGINISNICPL